MKIRHLIIPTLIIALLLSGGVKAEEGQYEDWTMFNHDPARTGYTTNKASPPFLTRIAYKTTAAIKSSMAITDKYAVIGSDDYYIYCYNTHTFRIKWQFRTGGEVWSSPSIYGDLVLCGSDDGNMYCLNLKQTKADMEVGDEVWRFETGGKVRSSPLVVNEKVYFTSRDGRLYCLDLTSGKQLWAAFLGGSSDASPTYYEEKDLVIVGSMPKNMYAYKADTGRGAWTFETKSHVQAACSVADGRLFFGTNEGEFYCLDANNGTKIWETQVGAHIAATPSLVNGLVIVCSRENAVKCFYQKDGEEVWEFRTTKWNYSSPAIGGDYAFFGSDDEHLYCIEWRTGNLVWKEDIGYIIQASPVIFNEAVYIGTWGGTVQAFHPGPILGVEPTEIDFGTVELGTTPVKDFLIKNTRSDEFETELDGSLTCDDIHLKFSSMEFFGIGNGSDKRVRITLDPSGMEYGNHQALVKITTNGGDENIVIRWKVITPAPPCMEVEPTEIDFGFLERGEEASKLVTITFDTENEVSGMVMGEDRWIEVEPITFTSIGKKAILKITVNGSRVPSGTEAMGRIVLATQNDVCQQVSVLVKIATEPRIVIKMIIGDKIAFVNMRPVELDVAPYVSSKGRTLVPLRFVSETFGAKVQWFGDEKKIIIERFDKRIVLWVGKPEYEVDGEMIPISTPPEIKSGRTMVPFRAIAEAFGADVSWDGETRTVSMEFEP
ncbi:MAG TPA: PQQ-binding-like beta-propeller repeat protein [Caldisericia bacterium]|nr:PQQ-binding-like beta-propeller repeat protein [Caldisericia bacterium]HPF48325.1 PQQ-binding-like beta-propeller repeat protein [Caldisericia bacterium]HPI83496.1 PQQ-binding-like beta-propeller repeat protein [Caldisericia bacterium]HPQ92778.1 PQQ-binding-like beta-propeller repeat protein [Caldisericia bacterium]HRV74124.1 PQQ-binding-like beta-propeller repeat protein [Caldisericia bacterium]